MDRRWLGLVLVVVLSVSLTAQDPYSDTLWEHDPDVPGLAGHWRAVFEQDLIAVLIVTDAHPGEIFATGGGFNTRGNPIQVFELTYLGLNDNGLFLGVREAYTSCDEEYQSNLAANAGRENFGPSLALTLSGCTGALDTADTQRLYLPSAPTTLRVDGLLGLMPPMHFDLHIDGTKLVPVLAGDTVSR